MIPLVQIMSQQLHQRVTCVRHESLIEAKVTPRRLCNKTYPNYVALHIMHEYESLLAMYSTPASKLVQAVFFFIVHQENHEP